MKASSITFDFGDNAFGQKITARRYNNYLGKIIWDIKRHSANHRDEEVLISGITDQQMLDFAEAVKGLKNLS
jgi:hypothetical protein